VVVVVVMSLPGLVVVVVVVVDDDDGGGGEAAAAESGMPKGVSSSFSLEEDATLGVAERCARTDCALERALSLR
jgi:hypothetical protein